jgi:hypothetical protein
MPSTNDESASTETGAIVLDLLLKAGVIKVEEDGKYRSGDVDKFVLLFGDVKTVDNMDLIIETIRKSMNGGGYTELSNQLMMVFEKASSAYGGETGKGAHAKDEKCELLNYEMSRLPMPRTKDGFVSQSQYIGVAKKAKHTIE